MARKQHRVCLCQLARVRSPSTQASLLNTRTAARTYSHLFSNCQCASAICLRTCYHTRRRICYVGYASVLYILSPRLHAARKAG